MKFIEAFVGLIALAIAIAIIGTILYFFPPQKGSDVKKEVKEEPTEQIERSGRWRIPDDGQK